MILLPNMRWLALPSEFSGEDWREVSLKIDEMMAGTGLDLADEAVYLLYDSNPEDVMNGLARCKVARSVVGPKKDPGAPFELIDWKAAKVIEKPLKSKTWDECFGQAVAEWKSVGNSSKVFMLCIRRRLIPELSLETTAIFAE